MRARAIRWILPFVLLAGSAQAEVAVAHYAAYAVGLNVLAVDARFELSPAAYRLEIGYRTTGAVGFFLRSQQDTVVSGVFAEGRARPAHFASSGTLRGTARVTEIQYRAGQPHVRQLQPSNGSEREEVLPAEQAGTIDTLSAMAQLIAQVTRTGQCDGTVRTFDGRRLATLQAWTIGTEVIPPSNMSSFAGSALHCEFEGRQIGGFMLDEDRARLQQPQRGSAWFASVVPGGPALPVRISFRTKWFGDATMYLIDRR